MVEEGFLTVEQLQLAIAEQHRTSKPLGQVLVDLGLVSAGTVANALADQHGGPVRTEFGISAGFRPQAAAPAPALTPQEPAPLRVAGTTAPTEGSNGAERRRLVAELDALRDHCESLSRNVSRLAAEIERVRDSV
jgi:hypothetical protein